MGGLIASLPSIIEEEQTSRGGTGSGDGWMVTVYNNDHNTYDEVATVLMVATGCSLEEAEIETWEIDHLGKSNVHFAGEQECRDVAGIIATIGIKVEVSQEA
jgi:hypothetical protein